MGAWAWPSFSLPQQLPYGAATLLLLELTGARLIGLKGLYACWAFWPLCSPRWPLCRLIPDLYSLSLGEGVGAKRVLMARDQRLRGVKPPPQKVTPISPETSPSQVFS